MANVNAWTDGGFLQPVHRMKRLAFRRTSYSGPSNDKALAMSRLALPYALIWVAVLVNGVRAETYTAIVLEPPGDFVTVIGRGISGGDQVGYAYQRSPHTEHAYLWRGSANSAVDLNPPGYGGSYAEDNYGNSQVGHGGAPSSVGGEHALLWYGSPESVVDLHPAGFFSSGALGASEDCQVGLGTLANGSGPHGLMWRGSAASVVDLYPSGFEKSYVEDADGNTQVGIGIATTGREYAILWRGSAASAISLNPSGFTSSNAKDVSGDYQVGFGYGTPTGGATHALLWNGQPNSFVDLNPTGFVHSQAVGISGNRQVGWGLGSISGNKNHALVWNSTAASAIDLHAFLTGLPITFTESYAYNVNSDGAIIGTAIGGSRAYAVLWIPGVPPSPLAGDYNHNGQVDAADYVVWRSQQGTPVTDCSGADGNCNGFIDAFDYQVWRDAFGRTTGSGVGATASIPEPSCFVLMVSAIVLAGSQLSRGRTHIH